MSFDSGRSCAIELLTLRYVYGSDHALKRSEHLCACKVGSCASFSDRPRYALASISHRGHNIVSGMELVHIASPTITHTLKKESKLLQLQHLSHEHI